MFLGKLLCVLGIHRPLTGHTSYFVDVVSGKTVYKAVCPCGKEFMVDSLGPFGGFKVEILKQGGCYEKKKTQIC